jgi:hypothetical protein
MLPGPEVFITVEELALTADYVAAADKAVELVWAKMLVGAKPPSGNLTEKQLRIILRHAQRLFRENPAKFNLPWELIKWLWWHVGEIAQEKLDALDSEGRWDCYWRVKWSNVALRIHLVWVAATWPRHAPEISSIYSRLPPE